ARPSPKRSRSAPRHSRTCGPIRSCRRSCADVTGPVVRCAMRTASTGQPSRTRCATGSERGDVVSAPVSGDAFRAGELLREAGRVLPDAVALRRQIHTHPELGLTLPRTQAAVLDAVRDLGLEDVRVGDEVTSVVGDLRGGAAAKNGPVILLRADMDALPMPEDTGLEYSSEVDGTMHACGHDAHVAMLVGAARLLAARSAALTGTVRFMFQPGEEGFHGARHMIDAGLLES